MFEIYKQSLSAKEFCTLYSSVGWESPSEEQVQLALNNSSFTVCIKDDGRPVGMGRAIGDGSMSFYIKDVAVLPDYQGKGIGKMIVESILSYIKDNTPNGYGVCVELISSENKESFYEKFGFGKKPGDGMGHGMMAMIFGAK